MKYFRLLSMLIVVVAVCSGGCTKQGAEGPQGPQGEQGPAGPMGDKGPKGDPGKTEPINVYYSNWINVEFTQSDDGLWSGSIDEPKVTQDILDKGNVLVYMFYNSTYIYKLPCKGTYTSPSMTTPVISLGKISIVTNKEKATTSATTFRYIIIPGDNHARSASPHPDYGDYQAVCRYYHISE